MSHRRSHSRARRAFTLAEMLTVLFIVGAFGSLVAFLIKPMITAPNEEQAKVDTLQTGTRAMYWLQRDLRQTSPTGVYVCTFPAPSTCNAASGSLASTPVLAVLTTRQNGNSQVNYDPGTGQAKWQGFNVYWLAPNARGGTDLVYAFEPSFTPLGSGDPVSGTLSATAVVAVNAALALSNPQVVGPDVTGLQTYVNVSTDAVGLKLTAQTAIGGHANETTYESDTFAQN